MDSCPPVIHAFAFDAERGTIADGRILVTVAEDVGAPDGMTVDADGDLWVAIYGGGRVQRYSSAGVLLEELFVPAEQSTCCAFAGPGLNRLYVTTVLVVAVAAHVSDVLGGSVYKGKVSEHLNRARAALDAARTMAEQAGVEAEFEVFEGDAAEEIAMIAESRDADLVVVGTRGHGGIAGSLLGSVSADVVRRSKRPVVVVHEPS